MKITAISKKKIDPFKAAFLIPFFIENDRSQLFHLALHVTPLKMVNNPRVHLTYL